MIEITTNPDKDTWRSFVKRHPRGNIFQTPEIAEVFSTTKNYSPLTLAAIDRDSGDIVALLNAAIISEFNQLVAPFTSRSVIIGGPLFSDTPEGFHAVTLLMEHYENNYSKRVIYTDIRNLWDTDHQLLNTDYAYEEHLNYLIDLTGGKEQIWSNLSKARRYGISRSKKSGVTIEELKSENDLPVLYHLLKDTYTKARHPLADKSLFDSIYSYLIPKKMAKIFFARYENKEIGAIVFLLYKDRIYDWYSCSLKECSKMYPNDLLVWYGLEWGLLNQYSVFDFMGAGKPDEKYGVREFKRQFGGTLVNFGRYKKVHSPMKNWVAQRGLSIYKKLGNHVRFCH
jgi:serine/alanine adding enzyme